MLACKDKDKRAVIDLIGGGIGGAGGGGRNNFRQYYVPGNSIYGKTGSLSLEEAYGGRVALSSLLTDS